MIKKNNVELTIEDLGSSNGTILNGNRIKKSNLIAGDEFVIGGVTFTVRYQSEFLSEESSNVMPVDAYQTVEVEEVVEVESDDVQEETSIDNLGGFTDTGHREVDNKANSKRPRNEKEGIVCPGSFSSCLDLLR